MTAAAEPAAIAVSAAIRVVAAMHGRPAVTAHHGLAQPSPQTARWQVRFTRPVHAGRDSVGKELKREPEATGRVEGASASLHGAHCRRLQCRRPLCVADRANARPGPLLSALHRSVAGHVCSDYELNDSRHDRGGGPGPGRRGRRLPRRSLATSGRAAAVQPSSRVAAVPPCLATHPILAAGGRLASCAPGLDALGLARCPQRRSGLRHRDLSGLRRMAMTGVTGLAEIRGVNMCDARDL
jgi:hypothetical protein